jgi:hypothetical protein
VKNLDKKVALESYRNVAAIETARGQVEYNDMTREEILAFYEVPATREEVLAQFNEYYRTTGFRPACTVAKADGSLHWLTNNTVEQLQDEMIGMIDAADNYREDFKSWLHRQ